MDVFLTVLFIVVIAYVLYRGKKLGYFDEKTEAAPVAVKLHVGRYTGALNPATSGVWGGANDEHDLAYTAQVLAGNPEWRGLGYCPGGSFAFEVHPDGGISGAADIYGHSCPVDGRPMLVAGTSEIEFTVLAHMVKLKFDNGAVTGLIWEGHDLLKRANIVGSRV